MRIFKKKNNTVITAFNGSRTKSQSKRLCHAPFVSLRFSQSGNILACCYNRGFVLGKYPEQSIHDVWFGSNIKLLRKNIIKNNLALGCGECNRRLEKGLFNLSGAAQYDYLSEYYNNKYPVMFDLEISNICNLECVMCLGENSSGIRSERDNLPPCEQHYDKDFIEQLKEFIPYLKEVRFSGGEPFLIPLYYDIWDALIEINPTVKISVLTNATILNNRIRDLLTKGNFQISVSFDSLQKETYEKIRKKADFDETLKNLDFFYLYAQSKKAVFCLNVCALRHNWSEIPSIVRYCNEKKMQLILHSVVFPPSESLWASDSNTLKDVLNCLEKANIETSDILSENNKITFNHFITQLKGWLADALIFEQKKIKLNNKTAEELLPLLIEHISPVSDEFLTVIESILSNFDINEQQKIMLNLLRVSPDLIISELSHNETEKLIIRFKMFNYNTL